MDSTLCKSEIVSFIDVSEINTGKRALKLSLKETLFFLFVRVLFLRVLFLSEYILYYIVFNF